MKNPTYRRESLFYGRWRVGEVLTPADELTPHGRAYVPDPALRSTPELAEVVSYIDFSIASLPAADKGHGDEIALEWQRRFGDLLDSNDWRLVDEDGKRTPIHPPRFFSERRIGCHARPEHEILDDVIGTIVLYLDPGFVGVRLREYLESRWGLSLPAKKSRWSGAEWRNVLSPENVERVRAAFEKPHNLVFGNHFYYYAGSSPSEFVFTDLDTYLAVVEASRIGDHFTSFSLADVRHLAFATFGSPESDAPIDPSGDELERLEHLLKSDADVTVVRRKVDPSSDRTVGEVEGTCELDEEEWQETLAEWRQLDGELLVFEDDVLEQDQDGVPVYSVGADGDRRRVHALVDARRPNAQGRTPLSGSY